MHAPGAGQDHPVTRADHASEVTVDLPQGPRAASVARSATREVLGRWRLPSVLDDVLVTVSELVTNAVRHGKPNVWLVLTHRLTSLDVAVHDERPLDGGSMRGSSNDDAESGRGLQIVRSLSDGVRYEDVPNDGKFVHARFSTPPDASSPAP